MGCAPLPGEAATESSPQTKGETAAGDAARGDELSSKPISDESSAVGADASSA